MLIVFELDGFLAEEVNERDPFNIGGVRNGIMELLVHSIPAIARRHRIQSDQYGMVILTDRFEWPIPGGPSNNLKTKFSFARERANRQIEKHIKFWAHQNGLWSRSRRTKSLRRTG